jgi:uncharacterized membrane protein YeaQ/YmgE (transglycosylase-associated protein family)
MAVYSWVVFGVVVGTIGHLILRGRGYDWFGEVLVGIAGAYVFGCYGPIILGVRTGSVDILSYAGLICTLLGAVLAVGLLIVLTPSNRSTVRMPAPAPSGSGPAGPPGQSASV